MGETRHTSSDSPETRTLKDVASRFHGKDGGGSKTEGHLTGRGTAAEIINYMWVMLSVASVFRG